MKRNVKFTLIELLVVVAIIGILFSLLLPVLGKARERMRTTQCINKQKSIGTFIEMQVEDNNSTYLSQDNAYEAEGYFEDGTLNTTRFGNYQVDLDKDYVRNLELFICPKTRELNSKQSFRDNYSFNAHLHNTRITDLNNISQTTLITDTNFEYLQSNFPGRIDVRHDNNNKLNVLFADGHVETMIWTKYYQNRQWLTLEQIQTPWTGSFSFE